MEAAANNVGDGVTNLKKAAWYQVCSEVRICNALSITSNYSRYGVWGKLEILLFQSCWRYTPFIHCDLIDSISHLLMIVHKGYREMSLFWIHLPLCVQCI